MFRTKTKLPKALMQGMKKQSPNGLMGGYMPDPPENCPKPIETHPQDGRRYINAVICKICQTPCQRRADFIQEWKEYREYLKEQGYINKEDTQ